MSWKFDPAISCCPSLKLVILCDYLVMFFLISRVQDLPWLKSFGRRPLQSLQLVLAQDDDFPLKPWSWSQLEPDVMSGEDLICTGWTDVDRKGTCCWCAHEHCEILASCLVFSVTSRIAKSIRFNKFIRVCVCAWTNPFEISFASVWPSEMQQYQNISSTMLHIWEVPKL